MIDAFDIVIFGGTGDLSLRKLLPALYRAHKEKELPEGTRIFSSCRSLDKRDDYLDIVAVALEKYLDANEFADEHWQTFKNLLQPIALDIVKRRQTAELSLDPARSCAMQDLINQALADARSYPDYRTHLTELLAEGKTTGPNQSDDYDSYQKELHLWYARDKTASTQRELVKRIKSSLIPA